MHAHEPVTGHETRDASVRAVVITLGFLAFGAAIVCGLVYGIFWYLADHPLSVAAPNPLAETEKQQFPPAPRIQEHPAIDLQDLRGQEDKILSTYGWTNKNAGIVRVPIDRAMELQLRRGFPTRKER
jgi:hypothetical protein